MERSITGFFTDDDDDWVARLACGHGRHVRHRPPWDDRPWTQTEAGRASMVGRTMTCVRCDEREPPDGLAEVRRTPTFDERGIPAGLLRDHTTRAGTWGEIVVEGGSLELTVPHAGIRAAERVLITPTSAAWVAPGQLHSVTAPGEVRFHVRFHRVDVSTP